MSKITVGQQIRISPTFGNPNSLDDLSARDQLAIIVKDLGKQGLLFRNLYEVRLVSGAAAGESRLVTASEMTIEA